MLRRYAAPLTEPPRVSQAHVLRCLTTPLSWQSSRREFPDRSALPALLSVPRFQFLPNPRMAPQLTPCRPVPPPARAPCGRAPFVAGARIPTIAHRPLLARKG